MSKVIVIVLALLVRLAVIRLALIVILALLLRLILLLLFSCSISAQNLLQRSSLVIKYKSKEPKLEKPIVYKIQQLLKKSSIYRRLLQLQALSYLIIYYNLTLVTRNSTKVQRLASYLLSSTSKSLSKFLSKSLPISSSILQPTLQRSLRAYMLLFLLAKFRLQYISLVL